MSFDQRLDQTDQKGKEDAPEPWAITGMTGMEGMVRTESGDEEGMTVIPSAGTDRNDYKR